MVKLNLASRIRKHSLFLTFSALSVSCVIGLNFFFQYNDAKQAHFISQNIVENNCAVVDRYFE